MDSRLLILFLLLLTLSFSAKSQTLEFNQVLLVEIAAQNDTVPQGKAWKIESAVCELNISSAVYFMVNFNSIVLSNGTGGWGQMTRNAFPMWLPEGTIVSAGAGVSALSILEFNTQ